MKRGTTIWCLRHFIDEGGDISDLSRFTGVQLATLRKWVSRGEFSSTNYSYTLLIRAYLINKGYQLIEYDPIKNALALRCLEAIGQGVITMKDLMEVTGYAASDTLYNFLKGKTGTGKKKSIQAFLNHKSFEPTSHPEISHEVREENKIIISCTITLLNSLEPLLEVLLSDKLEPSERRSFRTEIGIERLFQLSNKVSRLCNETSRNKIKPLS